MFETSQLGLWLNGLVVVIDVFWSSFSQWFVDVLVVCMAMVINE